jgi:fructoselysine-6-P-deglycase FrlB-like protein
MSMNAPTDKPRSGLDLLEAEMARQHADALASLRANAEMAIRIAASVMRSRRLLLIGMGASHYANRMVEPLYRRLGIDAWACTAADLMHTPPPTVPQTAILVSQSGESGEIVELLKRNAAGEDRFGMTLDPSSTLGRTLPCLVGAGGSEVAFAATRSLVVTLALHAPLLAALGQADQGPVDSLQRPVIPPLDEALGALAGKTTIVLAGRGVFRGVAEAGSLMLMELARMPTLGFEIGQFRHGPLELLAPEIGVVLFCGAAADRAAVASLAQAAADAGSAAVVFDCSGGTPVRTAINIAFSPRQDLAAVFAVLPALQRLIISTATRKVDRVGEPIRSTQSTREAS